MKIVEHWFEIKKKNLRKNRGLKIVLKTYLEVADAIVDSSGKGFDIDTAILTKLLVVLIAVIDAETFDHRRETLQDDQNVRYDVSGCGDESAWDAGESFDKIESGHAGGNCRGDDVRREEVGTTGKRSAKADQTEDLKRNFWSWSEEKLRFGRKI